MWDKKISGRLKKARWYYLQDAIGKVKRVKLISVVKPKTRKKLPKVLVKSKRQTGKRKSLKKDEQFKAMFPGKRMSKTGKIYYKYRRNRTDTHKDKKGKWI